MHIRLLFLQIYVYQRHKTLILIVSDNESPKLTIIILQIFRSSVTPEKEYY